MASAADNTPHCASNPISAKSRKTTPIPRPVSIGEFSTKTKRGPTARMILAISRHNPLRVPSIPSPSPAALMSWHGKPPQTASTRPRHGLPSNVPTSSQIGNLGRYPSRWRWSRTALRNGSISTAQTGVCPSKILPRMPPPHPAKRWSSRMGLSGSNTSRIWKV